MAAKLAANVAVVDPETGQVKVLLEGDPLPEWAADQVGGHVLDGKQPATKSASKPS